MIEDPKYVKIFVWSAPGQSRPEFSDAVSGYFKLAKIGDNYGPSWTTHWFRIQLTVPSLLLNEERLEFHWDSEGEAMVWTEDGKPLQGLTPGERTNWILPENFRDGKEHTFFIEMACNGMFGNPRNGDAVLPPDEDRRFTLKLARLVAVNMLARALYFDYCTISGMLQPH